MQNFGFKCITMEAELMCELLKQGFEPTDDIIQQSSVIRMCALAFLGQRSIAYAAALLVRACLPKRAEQKSMHPFPFCKLPTHWH